MTGVDGDDPGRGERVNLPANGQGEAFTLEFLRFGPKGGRPKAYLQAGLHADELPGMLVLKKLAEALARLESEGCVLGEIVLAPAANPIGLSQIEGGYMRGRTEARTGRNFNRGFPDLAALVKEQVAGRLGDDAASNVAVIRKAFRETVSVLPRPDAATALQLALFEEACDADIALDLHADNEALLHLYVGKPSWPDAEDLAAELDARAVLLTDRSGGEPFDEACGDPWRQLAELFPGHPIPQACLAATLELRSNNHVTHEDSDRDMRALLRFLVRRRLLAGEPRGLPRLLADAHDVRAMHQLRSPVSGLVVYRLKLGDRVRKDDLVAEIIPLQGEPVEIVAETDGVLFARHDQAWAWPDKVIGKIAGRDALVAPDKKIMTD